MAKRYSKRAYRKRTQRKHRVNRRRTQKGGIFGNVSNMFSKAKEMGTNALANTPAAQSIIQNVKQAKEMGTNALANTSLGQTFTKWNNMNFQDRILEGFGVTMTLFVKFSKMVMSLMVYVYIANVMIRDPAAAKEILNAKKDELMAEYPRLFACINSALNAAKSPQTQTQTQSIPDAPPKTLVETLIERKNQLSTAPNKLEFMKGLINEKINKMNQDIERIKTNPELRDCFEEAKTNVNNKKTELMTTLQNDKTINSILEKITSMKEALPSMDDVTSKVKGAFGSLLPNGSSPSPLPMGTRVLGSGETRSFMSGYTGR